MISILRPGDIEPLTLVSDFLFPNNLRLMKYQKKFQNCNTKKKLLRLGIVP